MEKTLDAMLLWGKFYWVELLRTINCFGWFQRSQK